MTGKDESDTVPRDIDESALDAATGGGNATPTGTVTFTIGNGASRTFTREQGDPDRPILVGNVPNPA